MVKGIIKRKCNGYLFTKITDEDSVYRGEDVFCYITEFIDKDFDKLREGDFVNIERIEKEAKGLSGKKITFVEKQMKRQEKDYVSKDLL